MVSLLHELFLFDLLPILIESFPDLGERDREAVSCEHEQ